MHIMEGYLPPVHAAAWTATAAVFVVAGVRRIQTLIDDDPRSKFLLAAAGAFSFVLSALKLPSVTGSSSHPTGTGLGAILFGPPVMAVLGTIVLLFQALILAHGGLTTLGANIISMAVVGPWVAYWVFHFFTGIDGSREIAILAGASLGNLATYGVTALQLALAFPDSASGVTGSLIKFLGVFAITQIPLAITEGLLTVVVLNTLSQYGFQTLGQHSIFAREGQAHDA